MADVRIGVSAPVHLVLDRLDKGRVAWGTLSDDGLRDEIAIAAATLDGIKQIGEEPMASPAARWVAALLLFGIERAALRQAQGERAFDEVTL